MRTSEEVKEIYLSLNKFQSAINSIPKTAKSYNSTYTPLEDIWSHIRLPLTENGLAIVQDAYTQDGCVFVTTRVTHTSGQWIECGPLSMPIGQKDARGHGSCLSYARRYSVAPILGLTFIEEDDDAQTGAIDTPKSAPAKAEPSESEKEEQKMVRLFFKKWENSCGRDELIKFIDYRADLLRTTGRRIINTYKSNDVGFQKDFDSWLANINDQESSHDDDRKD